MAEESNNRVEDHNLISLSEKYEIHDWCRAPQCTEEELLSAVKYKDPHPKYVDRA